MAEQHKKHAHDRPVNCWVDKVGFLSLAKLFFVRLRFPFGVVRYAEQTRFGRWIVQSGLLNKIFCFWKMKYKLSKMFLEEEFNIYWALYRDASTLALTIAKNAGVEEGALKALHQRYSKQKVGLFLKQAIVDDIRPYVKFNNIVNWFLKTENLKRSTHVLLVKNNGWFSYLKGYNDHCFQTVFHYPDLKHVLRMPFYFIKSIWEFVINSACWLCFFGRPKIEKSDKGKIAVLHVQGADLSMRSDFFWFHDSKIDPSQILVYFRMPHRPLNKKVTDLLKENGMSWTDTSPKNFIPRIEGLQFYFYPSKLYVRNSFKVLIEFLRLLFFLVFGKKKKKLLLWQIKNLFILLNNVAFYESFFKDHNVKVHFSQFELGNQMSATNLAAELAGAVDISSQYSNYALTFLEHGKPHDVYFAWGPYYQELFANDYYRTNYLVYCGYSYDYLFNREIEGLKDMRDSLSQEGAQFVISFFDEAYVEGWGLSKDDFREIYKVFLRELLADPTLGLIVKPKRLQYYLGALKESLDLIHEAQKTKRCVLLDEKIMPSQAALISDIAVGLEVNNTAALEAALAGVPTVALNCGEMRFHRFCKSSSGKIVFDDVEQLMEQIRNFRAADSPTNGFANYAPFLNQVDPFRDGKASQRVGQYMKDLLSELSKGSSKEEALNKINRRYCEQFGDDKVIHCCHN
jgi:hypothetical protein